MQGSISFTTHPTLGEVVILGTDARKFVLLDLRGWKKLVPALHISS